MTMMRYITILPPLPNGNAPREFRFTDEGRARRMAEKFGGEYKGFLPVPASTLPECIRHLGEQS